MRKALFTGIAAAMLLTIGLAGPAQAASVGPPSGKAEVFVLHAVPKTPVDVYVDGHLTLNDFKPGTLAGPLALKAGTYTVAITAATAKNDRHPIIGPVKVTVRAGSDYTIVAHLTPSGAPTASVYVDPLRAPLNGEGRLIVRHDAAAPAVDVFANGARSMTGLTNPDQSRLGVKAGSYAVAVALAGTTKPVIGPATITVAPHTDTIVYAWGSAAQGDLTVAVQTLRTR